MSSFFVGVGVGGPVAVYEVNDCCCPDDVFTGTAQQVADEIARLVRGVVDEKSCEHKPEPVRDRFKNRGDASIGHQFKVGDFVRCVDNDDGFFEDLTVGKVYRVIDVSPNGVRIKFDLGDEEFCFASRFKKVDPPKPGPGVAIQGRRQGEVPGFLGRVGVLPAT